MHLTQPAVSLQIKNLQEMLGVVLFSRTSHGLLLTRDGEALLPHAERALAADVQYAAAALRCVTKVKRDAAHRHHSRSGIFAARRVFLRQLVEAYPRIATALRHDMSGWVLERVKTREFDVGYYIGDPVTDGTRRWRALSVRLTPRARAGGMAQPCQGKRNWSALGRHPWIWTPPESPHNRLLSRIFREAGARPTIVAEVDQEYSMLDLMKSGVGLSMVRDSIALGEAHVLTIVEGVTVPTQLSFNAQRRGSSRRNGPCKPAHARLSNVVHTMFVNLDPFPGPFPVHPCIRSRRSWHATSESRPAPITSTNCANAPRRSSPLVFRQQDFFYDVPKGRLKLRQFDDGTPSELIFYQRDDRDGPKVSYYTRSPVTNPEAMHALLA